MNRLIKPGRVFALGVLLAILIIVYLVELYKLQIVQGEEYYNQSKNNITVEDTVTAIRGNILDRYGRVLVSDEECYNLEIDTKKLFGESTDEEIQQANRTILALVDMVSMYGDSYTDDLPVTKEPPFEYTDMTSIQQTMLEAYFERQKLDKDTTAVELMSYMRTRYAIANDYSAQQMRTVAGVRYSINVRYAIPTADYVFVQDASMKLISSILENKLAGIEISRAFKRTYSTEYAAHLLGYTGLMTQEEYEKYSLLEYANDAQVGKDGVELAFEEYLHGKDGKTQVTTTSTGTVLSTVYTKEPKPGDHVYLTIDIQLQEATERLLASGLETLIANREQERAETLGRGEEYPEKYEITGASVVVVDVRTGEPLAMASWPTYDVSTIMENYSKLLEDEKAPLFNRALMGAYAPGSTFKPCTAIAGLTEKIIDTDTIIKDEGIFSKYADQGYAPECWIWSMYHYTHGDMDVTHAIMHSCNYFFYTVGHDLGIDKLDKYAAAFGLGESTGIELTETRGNMAKAANHYDYAGQDWTIGDSMQAAIGQSDSIFTPIQMAEYCATVANRGTRHSASILKSVRTFDYSEELFSRETEILSTVDTADYNWDAIQKGMYLVANDPLGTAYDHFYDCNYTVAAKTGTAQKGDNVVNDGIFMCYAPYNDPQIAVAILVERGGSGNDVSSIARKIVETYFNIMSYSDVSEEEMALLK